MLRVRSLGTVPYEEAFALQQALARRSGDDYLLALQHPHVYTLGVRADPAHVLVDPALVGASLVRTNRGGDVTYHGPGQLVLYPVLSVADHPSAGPAHVHRIEEVIIDALRGLGVGTPSGGVGRLGGYPGVWVGVDGSDPKKVAAIGVRTTKSEDGRRRTLHGVALNVSCDLSMFAHIVPCGIADRPVTSLEAEGFTGTFDDVMRAVISRAIAEWGEGQADIQEVISGPTTKPAITKPASTKPAITKPAITKLEGEQIRLSSAETERPLLRRLRQAGVDPNDALEASVRKPEWLRAQVRMGEGFLGLGRTVHKHNLTTVCEEAGCPNIFECWSEGTATFMVNGSRCTRACGFCLVDTSHPFPLDPTEPQRVADAVREMGLSHAVVTCVARDDLLDGGAGAIAATVSAIRERCPTTAVETLISDCKGDHQALEIIFDARPDVLNHNIETVARLQRAVRPSAGYARSLAVLARAFDAGLVTKSGMMVGLGETEDEVLATLADLRSVGVSIVTIGQYLRPTREHLPVWRWWTPQEFDRLRHAGLSMGLAHVEASPLTRSSYHARQASEAAGKVPVSIRTAKSAS